MRLKITFVVLSIFMIINIALYVTEKFFITDKIFYKDVDLTNEYQFNREDYIKYAYNEATIRNTKDNDKYIIEKLSLLLDENKISEKYNLLPDNEFFLNNDITGWDSENVSFLVPDLYLTRQLNIPYLIKHTEILRKKSSLEKNILVVGDSFAQGLGSENLDTTIPYQIEKELNKKYNTNIFKTTVFGAGGAGLEDYNQWLSAEMIKKVKPEFIIIMFFENDITPMSGRLRADIAEKNFDIYNRERFEKLAYNKCLDGEIGFLGAIIKNSIKKVYPSISNNILKYYCDQSKILYKYNKVTADELRKFPEKNPYIESFKEDARSIVKKAGDIPVYLLPISYNEGNSSIYSKYRGYPELFKEAGMIVAESKHLRHVDKLFEKNNIKFKYYANPGDAHYNSEVAHGYAKAIVELISENLKSKRYDYVEGLPNITEESILSDYLPGDIAVYRNNNELLAGYMYQRRNEAVYKNVDKFLRSESKNGEKYYSLGPCMRLNRPHLRFTVNYKIAENKNVNIEIIKSADEFLYFATFGYDENYKEIISQFRVIKKGEKISFKFSDNNSGFFIAKTEGGCPLDESIIGPEVLLKISLS